MEVRIINNPNNVIFPLAREDFENLNLVYHGTRSCFSNLIQDNGWVMHSPPYNFDDVEYIIEQTRIKGYKINGVGMLIAFTTKTDAIQSNERNLRLKYPSFSQNYWTARAYSNYRGGETVHNILLAVEEFLYNYKKFSEIIEKEIIDRFDEIKNKYRNIIGDSYPVVYVIEIDPEWFSPWEVRENTYQKPRDEIVLIRDVVPECIKARIDFPKGLHPFHPKYEYPLPLEWSLEGFIESLGDYESIHIDPILKEYLKGS